MKNTKHTPIIATLLASPLSEHCFKTDAVTIYADTPNPQTCRDYRLDLAGLYVGSIHGCDSALPYGGHEMPSIEQAEAIRAEVMRRWNSHDELLAALKEMTNKGSVFLKNEDYDKAREVIARAESQ